MRKRALDVFLPVLLVGLSLAVSAVWLAAVPQTASAQVDPFYLKVLSDGEQMYQAQNFREAAKNFDIACFGLSQDKVLLGKALGYLSLSYFNLKDDVQAKNCLARLVNLVGLAGLNSVALADHERRYLVQIADFYKLDQPSGGPSTPARTDIFGSARPKAPAQKKETPAGTLKDLEKRVKTQPQNSQAYLDLYEFARKQKDLKAARRALESMVKNLPADPAGPFLLGKMLFVDRDFGKAAESLEKFLALKKDAPAPDKDFGEAQAYLILCYNGLGQKPLLAKTCRDFLARSVPSTVLSFDLTEDNKNRVLSLLGQFEKSTAPARPPASTAAAPVPKAAVRPPQPASPDASSIQKEITRNPRDVSLYYGLYDLYRQKRDRPSAKQTLQNLVAANPFEARGFLLLGKLNYEDKDFEKAAEALLKILNFPSEISVEESVRSEAAFYLALSDYLGKNKTRAWQTYYTYLPLIQKMMSSGVTIADSDAMIWQNLSLAAEAARQVYLLAIRPERSETGLEVKIDLSRPVFFRTYVLTKEGSIVIELFQMAGIKAPEMVPVNSSGIKAVRSVMTGKDTVRVTLESRAQVPSHRIVKTDAGLSVIIEEPKSSGPGR